MCATVLANELKDATAQDGNANEASLEAALRNYQKARQSQSLTVVDLAHKIQKMEALETPVTKFIQLSLMKRAPIEMLGNAFGQWFAPAEHLKHLPLPSRRGLMPFTDEVKVKPQRRPNIITMLFALFLAAIVLLLYPYIQKGQEIPISTPEESSLIAKMTGLDRSRGIQLYYNMSITVITAIISVESYRICFSMGLLGRWVLRSYSLLIS